MNQMRAVKAAADPAGARAGASRVKAAAPRLGNQMIQQHARARAVPKLAIGHADDPAEAAAERMADRVTRGGAAAPCACGGTCAACTGARAATGMFAGGSGRPLEPGLRAYFEPRFGARLDAVRVHDDADAAATARRIGARAFTAGTDVGFARGQYAPGTEAGRRLLAHELAHTLRPDSAAVIRRQPSGDGGPAPTQPVPGGPAADVPAEAPAGAQKANPPPTPQGPIVGTLDGIQLVEDEEYMLYQMEQLAARDGTDAPLAFYGKLNADLAADRAFRRDYEADPSGVSGGVPRSEEELDAEARVITVMRNVMASIDQEETSFVHEFEEQARTNALAILDRSEKEERAEAFRYGIDWKIVSEPIADCLFGDCTRDVTRYSMGDQSPAITGLQAAAKILLTRRQDLDKAKDELEDAQQEMLEDDFSGDAAAEREASAEDTFQKKADSYDLTRGFLGKTYPILNALGDRDRSPDDLQTLTEQKSGPRMAALLGGEIAERLSNIAKVRKNLNDPDSINIWRLPTLIGVTRAQTDADTDPFHKRIIDEVVESAKPSALETIALLVFNIGALLLAGPTGGISLAVAAGVNAIVAVEHVKEYMMQSALTGTAFDKAQALSQDKPSLFWLAVDIIGVAVDASVAFKTISEALEAVEVAKAADVALKTKELNELAHGIGGDDLVRKIAAHLGEHPGAEGEALKALGIGEAEAKSLRGAAQAAEEELAAGTASGRAATGTAKLSRSGHIFSCASPCTWMREKFAALLGPDITLEGETSSLGQQYLAFEERAAKAAEEVRLAKGPEELAKAEDAAAALERELGEFDQKLTREMRGRQIDTALAGLGQKYTILQEAGLDHAAIERVLAKAGDIGHMKGQLLEELLASRVRAMLGTEAGRTALAGARAGAPLEFIDGFRITDAAGQQLTDGMILVQEGSRYRVVAVLESKAGAPSSRGLRYAYKGIKEMKPEELKVLRAEAIEELKEQNQALATMRQADIAKQYPKQVEDMMNSLTKGEAGQIRKDIERLAPSGGDRTTEILIDGKPREVIAGPRSTRTFGALPSDVSGVRTAERVRAQGLANFEAMNLGIKQAELEQLAQALADELAAAPSSTVP